MGWQSVPKGFDIRLSLHATRAAERTTATESWQRKKPRQKPRNFPKVHFLTAPNWKSMYRSIRRNGHHRPSNSLLICVSDRGTSIFWSKHSRITACSSGLVRVVRQKVTINRSIQVLLGYAITPPLLAVDLTDLARISQGRIGQLAKVNSNFIDSSVFSSSTALWTCLLCDSQKMTLEKIESVAETILSAYPESSHRLCFLEGKGTTETFLCGFMLES